jgi:GrpB-like predicted nucleotidyltransferase (UPF0157 family)
MDIGLKKDTVRLVPHNPIWKDLFQKEKELLLATFPGQILKVSHGGSTAIPDIPAKPLIDIFAVVPSLQVAEDMRGQLEGLGYEYRGEEGIPERRFYAKGDREKRSHNLHLVEETSNEWKNHLLIKNYYLKHPEAALAYAELKEKLAKQFPDDRVAYRGGKDAYIKQVIQRAVDEGQKE